jgi:uncharacterized protein
MTPPDDDKLDETLEETFPASDAPANTVETGIQLEAESPHAADVVVRDHPDARRFEAVVDGQVAYIDYERRADSMVLLHTYVPDALRGRGVGNRLAQGAIDAVRAQGLRLVVQCPFVRAYLRRHAPVP